MSDTISVTAARLDTHEAVCAQRYETITDRLEKGAERMDKMQYLIYAVLAAVLLGPGAAASLFAKIFGL